MNVILARTGKQMKLNQSTQFLADDRSTVDEAVSGDIIGLYDTGTYQIGDTVCEGKQIFHYDPLPQFTPELFVRVTAKNVMKQKQFHKGLNNWFKKGLFSFIKRNLKIIYLVPSANCSSKFLNTA